jgi:hypothetical protein
MISFALFRECNLKEVRIVFECGMYSSVKYKMAFAYSDVAVIKTPTIPPKPRQMQSSHFVLSISCNNDGAHHNLGAKCLGALHIIVLEFYNVICFSILICKNIICGPEGLVSGPFLLLLRSAQ